MKHKKFITSIAVLSGFLLAFSSQIVSESDDVFISDKEEETFVVLEGK